MFTRPPHRIRTAALALTATLALTAALASDATAQPAFANPGFETPALQPGEFQPYFIGTSWTGDPFFNNTGITNNFTFATQFNPPAPEGSQVAFLNQGYSVRQTVFLPPGRYYISLKAASSFDFAGRREFPSGLRIVRNGVDLLFDERFPANVYTYRELNTRAFTVTTADNHLFVFTATGSAMAVLDDIQIVANNELPTVQITTPTNNQGFDLPATVAFSASASDSDGIRSVQFFIGTVPLSNVLTTPPYTVSLALTTTGSFTVHAKAIDTLGGATLSAPVTIVATELDYDLLGEVVLHLSSSPDDEPVRINQDKSLSGYGAIGQSLRFSVSLNTPASTHDLFRSDAAGHVVIGLNHRFFPSLPGQPRAAGNRFAGVIIGNACGPRGGIGLEWKLETATLDGTEGTLTPLLPIAGPKGPPCIELHGAGLDQLTSVIVDINALGNGCASLTVWTPSMLPIGSASGCAGTPPLGNYTSDFAGISVVSIRDAAAPPFEVHIQPHAQQLSYR